MVHIHALIVIAIISEIYAGIRHLFIKSRIFHPYNSIPQVAQNDNQNPGSYTIDHGEYSQNHTTTRNKREILDIFVPNV
jgi:DUF1680 family protein